MGDYDYQKLGDLLNELEFNGFNLEFTGFQDLNLNEGAFDFDVDDDSIIQGGDYEELDDGFINEFPFDEVTEVKTTFYLVEGDVWEFGNHKLVVGEPSDMKLKLQFDSEDLIVSTTKLKQDEINPLKELEEKNRKCVGIKPPYAR